MSRTALDVGRVSYAIRARRAAHAPRSTAATFPMMLVDGAWVLNLSSGDDNYRFGGA